MERAKTTAIADFITAQVAEYPTTIAKLTAEHFGISRQAVNQHLQKLISRGVLQATGSTRARAYKLKPLVSETHTLQLADGLAEDRVWRVYVAPLLLAVPKNVDDICHYGFTEMFNNVLDHSDAKEVTFKIEMNFAEIEIWISDDGIGIFEKVKTALKLEDHRHAILELAKGKVTTDPARHTGEGIFFTSRMFDRFTLCSGLLYFDHKEPGDDWLIEDSEEMVKGTAVRLRISQTCSRTTKEVFDKYASELDDFGFTRTHVPVSLLRYGDEYLVSRSQAKRLLARFDRFKEVFLDFEGVSKIGQAFADEIFRVFKNQNPSVKLVWVRASKDVEEMIHKVMANDGASDG